MTITNCCGITPIKSPSVPEAAIYVTHVYRLCGSDGTVAFVYLHLQGGAYRCHAQEQRHDAGVAEDGLNW
jgi:hypothetical protein